MSEPELKLEIDEHGRIGYRVTNEGVLLSKDEKEFIIDHVTRMQAENSKLRELVRKMMRFFEDGDYCAACEKVAECDAQEEYDDDCLMRGVFHAAMRELGIEVDG